MTFNSHQDFHTQMAVIAKPFTFTRGSHQVLGRTIASENQAQFERHLHESMGWKRSTVNDWEV